MKLDLILLLTRKPQIYSSRRLAEALTRQGRKFEILDPEAPWLDLRPSLVFPRLGTWHFSEAIENLKKQATARFINSLEAYQRARNKWLSLNLLQKKGIQTPSTQLFHRDEMALVDWPFPFVLKEVFLSQGMGVHLINSQSDLVKVLEGSDSQVFLAQEYIKECHGQDLRIFLTRRGDSWAYLRKNETGDLRSNLSVGGKALKTTALPEEMDLAVQTLQELGLDYAGLDFLRSSQGPLVLEANPCPGFEGLETLYGPVVAEALLSLADN